MSPTAAMYVGVVCLVAGLLLTTFGGYLTKDGWDRNKTLNTPGKQRDTFSGNFGGSISIYNYGNSEATEVTLSQAAKLRNHINQLSADILDFAAQRRMSEPSKTATTPEDFRRNVDISIQYGNDTRAQYVRRFAGPVSAACEELKRIGKNDDYLDRIGSLGVNQLTIEEVGTRLARIATQLPDK